MDFANLDQSASVRQTYNEPDALPQANHYTADISNCMQNMNLGDHKDFPSNPEEQNSPAT